MCDDKFPVATIHGKPSVKAYHARIIYIENKICK